MGGVESENPIIKVKFVSDKFGVFYWNIFIGIGYSSVYL